MALRKMPHPEVPREASLEGRPIFPARRRLCFASSALTAISKLRYKGCGLAGRNLQRNRRRRDCRPSRRHAGAVSAACRADCLGRIEQPERAVCQALEGKLWELRLTGRDGIARALYVTAIGRRVVVVRAFVKEPEDAARRDRTGAASGKGDRTTISFEEIKSRLLANPEVKAEYDTLAPEFEIAAEPVKARLRAGLSQAELARRMGTSQSAIARLESGQTLPSTHALALRRGHRQQVSSAAVGGLTGRFTHTRQS
jgi:DNA-binding transcriptional regulator YiaG